MKPGEKLPRKVKVGFKTYSIERYKKEAQEETGNWGRVSHADARIRVHETADRRETANTLLHEILHACYRSGELTSEDNEEKVVTVLSNQLSCVIQDNDKVMDYLRKMLK